MSDTKTTVEELRSEIERLEARVTGLESALAQSFAAFSALQEREERYRLLVENLPDVAWTTDSSGHTVYISPQVEDTYGFTAEEVIRGGDELWFGRIHPDDREQVHDAFGRMMESGSAFDLEYRILHKRGEYIWLHDRAFVRSTKEGRRFAHGIFRDITSIKDAEGALRQLIDAAPFGAHLYELHDGQLVFTGANRAADRILGIDNRQFIGKPLEEAFPDLRRTDIPAAYRAVAEGGRTFEREELAYRDERISGAFEIIATSLGKGRMAAFFRDITERKKADEALHREKSKIDAVLAAMGDGLSIQDRQFRVQYQNEAHKALIGDHKGEFCYAAFEHRDGVCAPCPVALAFQDGKVHTVERSTQTDKGPLHVEITASPLRDPDGIIVAGIEVVRDITQRKRAEEDRHRSQEQSQILIDRMPVGCIMWDTGFRVALWNPAAERIFGYPVREALGKRADEIIVPESARNAVEEVWRKLLEGDEASHSINENRTRDGRTIVCEWRNTPVRDAAGRVAFVLSMVTDITDRQRVEEERRKLEAQLLQSQKMEAIGLLAGGVAHDFNNILSAILGYASMLQMKMRSDDPLRPHVDQVLSASQRAATLTQSLLAFSRKQIINPQPLLVNEGIRKIEKLLRRIIGEDIELAAVYADRDLTVIADIGQLEQVIINLATNARDAMPNGGTITLETGRAVIDGAFIRTQGFGRAGDYAVISMSDTGTGMDEKIRSRIFEPFFTTKELGKGTGLGLSTAYGIVKQNNGYITCSSSPGAGATFRVYLPLAAPGTSSEAAEEQGTAARGTETVLLAEDDVSMRGLFQSLLEEHGYAVLLAADGEEAIAQFRERAGDIDLLVLDVVMPKKNGKEVYDEARQVRPGMKVLFISGYTTDIVKRKGIVGEGQPFLAKPATPTGFLNKVREVLDAK